MKRLNKIIGHNLRRIRERRGWTQERLAEELGVDTSTISRRESGFSFRSIGEVGEGLAAAGIDPLLLLHTGDLDAEAARMAERFQQASPNTRDTIRHMLLLDERARGQDQAG